MRRMVSSGLAGALTLLLLGAAAGSGGGPTGTASTSISGLDVVITGAVPGDVSLVDLTTLATTDPAGTPAGPLARIALVPVASGGEEHGAVQVSSEDDGDATTTPTSMPAGGALDAGVDAVRMDASASADRAAAVVGATTASLSALTDALGIDLDLRGVESVVTQDSSTAAQSIGVSGFDLSLGDLVPLEILQLLPLDVLLELVQLLPIGVPHLETVVTDLLDVETRVKNTVTTLQGAAGDLEDSLDDLGSLEDAADAVDDAEQALRDLGVSEDLIQGIVDDPPTGLSDLLADPSIGSVGGGIGGDTDGDGTSGDELTDTVGGIIGGGGGGVLPGLSTGTVSAAALTALETAVVELVEAVEEQDDLENALGTIEEVTETITELVEQITTLITELQRLLDDVLALLIDLDGLLPDLLAALADGELLAVEDLTVGMTSVAGATLADSSASVECAATSVSVVGQSFQSPDCTSGLTGVGGTLQSALGIVSDVLGALPVATLEIPDVTLSLFPEVTESVTESDGTVTSVAGVTLLELSLPSAELDPDAVVEGLLSSLLDDLVADLTAQLPTSAELAGLDLTTELTGAIDAILTEVPDLSGLTDQVLAAVGELPLGVDLPELATPGLDMTMASSSTAAFTPGSATAPAPDPDGPSLPATGGGMAALGLLALLVGAGLRRRP